MVPAVPNNNTKAVAASSWNVADPPKLVLQLRAREVVLPGVQVPVEARKQFAPLSVFHVYVVS